MEETDGKCAARLIKDLKDGIKEMSKDVLFQM